jgi:hypothetical protein
MAHFETRVRTRASVDDAFAYLSDFANAAHWDPFVARVERDGRGAIRRGARFVITMVGLPGTRPACFHYTLTRFERNKVLEFTSETASLRSHDRITFEPASDGEGCVVHYDADLRPRGVWVLADLPLHLGFQLSGNLSAAGLRRALDALAEGARATETPASDHSTGHATGLSAST